MESQPASGASPTCILGVFTDDPLRLDGLRALLEVDSTYRVISLTKIERLIDVPLGLAMLDASRPHLASLVGHLRRVRPHVPVLVLGPDISAEETMEIVRLGAQGYLHHGASEAELRMALRVVLEGSIWAPRKVLARLLADTQRKTVEDPVLTRREREVLRLLVGGRSNRAIAEALEVDEATVKAHLGRLMRKLGVRNRVGLSLYALEWERHRSVIQLVNKPGNEGL